MDASSTQSVNILETFNAYYYRIYKLDFCSYVNFHIFRFSRSGKREIDVHHFMSKHSSDQGVTNGKWESLWDGETGVFLCEPERHFDVLDCETETSKRADSQNFEPQI